MERQKGIQVAEFMTDSKRLEKMQQEKERRRKIRRKKRRKKQIRKCIRIAKRCLMVLVVVTLFFAGLATIKANEQKNRFNEIQQRLTVIQQEMMKQANMLEGKWKELEAWQEVYQKEQGKLKEAARKLDNPEHYINYTYENGELSVFYIENGKMALENLNNITDIIKYWQVDSYRFNIVFFEEEIADFQEELTTQKIYRSNQVQASLLLHEIEVIKGMRIEQNELLLQIEGKRDSLQEEFDMLKGQLKDYKEIAQKLVKKEAQIEEFIQSLSATQEELQKLPERANNYTNCNVVELLARLGNGEGSICSDEEMQVILQVALNRVKSTKYKDSLIGVIFEKSQYACTYDNNFAKPITNKSIHNAISVLEGDVLRNVPEDVIYQSLEPLGDLWWKAEYHYFCR